MWSVFVQIFTALVLGIYSGSRISIGNSIILILLLFSTVLISGLFVHTTRFLASSGRGLIFKKFFPLKLFLIFVFSVGIFSYHYQTEERFRSAYPFKDRYITAIGKICELPEYKEDSNAYEANIQRIYYLGKIYKVNERIRLTSSQKLRFGDSIRAEGFLEGFNAPLNDGDFDTAQYYQYKRIYFRMQCDNIELCRTGIFENSPGYFFAMLKNHISDLINNNCSGERAAILHAVFLNNKNYFSEEIREMLTESNAMHVFYTPYLHISLILSFVALFKSVIPARKRNYLLIILLLLYASFNLNYPYIVKTALVAAISVYLKNKYGFVDYLDIFSIVASAILLFNPLAAFNSGFILSSCCNITIFKLYPIIREKISLKNVSRKQILSLWLTLLIAILPVQAFFFYQITPFAYLLSLIYIPLISTLFYTAPLGMFLKIPLIKHISTAITFILLNMPKRAMKLPFYIIHVPQPTITFILAYYLILAAFCLYQNKKSRFASALTSAVAVGLVFANIFYFCQDMDKLKIEFVNLSHGDGAVLSVPFGETIIIDGGGTSAFSDYDYGKNIFIPYLKRNGHTDIDLAVVSHYHEDHCKGTIAAMQKLKVHEVLMPDCMEDNEYRKEIEKIANEKNIALSYYKAGNTLKFKSGLNMKILSSASPSTPYKDENDTSFVIEIRYGEFSALFTGDITSNIEAKLLDTVGEYTLLKVPHHGSLTSSSEEFIKKISPECAVISTAENSVYSLPNAEVIKRYENNNAKIFRTDKNGNITFKADKNGEYSVSVFKKEKY